MRNPDQVENQQTIFDLLLWQATILAKKGQYPEAEQLLSNLRPAPNRQRAQASDLLAKIRIRQKRFSQALSLWQSALALDPENKTYQKAITQLPRFKKLNAWIPYLQGAVITGFCVCLLFSLNKITPAERTPLPKAKFIDHQALLSSPTTSVQSARLALTTLENPALNSSDQAKLTTALEKLETAATTNTAEDIVVSTIVKEETLQIAAEALIEEPDEILGKNHVIQFGETLSSLARQYFKDSSKFYLLVNSNKDRYPSLVDNPDNIRPGWVLIIPRIESEVQ
ncbi:MAG: LysM peptidoglycan-binding domain-containing protein [PVC group bacterium]